MSWPIVSSPVLGAVAGDVSPDGREVLIKNYARVFLYRRPPGATLAAALAADAPPLSLPYIQEPQGEAVCFDRTGGGYFTLSEWAVNSDAPDHPIYYYRRIGDNRPDGPSPLVMLAVVGCALLAYVWRLKTRVTAQ